MSGINRLGNIIYDNLGLDVWGNRDVIPQNFNIEILETNQQLQPNAIDASKIRNLVVDTITVSPTGFIKSGKTGPTDSTHSGYYFDSNGIYIGSSTDTFYLKYDIANGSLVVKGSIETAAGSSIDGEYITALSITADKIAAGTITAAQIAAGTITANEIEANSLTVGTNVGLGTAQDSAGVTSIIGNTVTTGFVNALDVNAKTVSANILITSPTIIGGIIKTTDTVGAGHNGVIMDTDGLRGYDYVLGETFNLPTNGDAPTFSSGIINETIFEISTNAVLRTSTTTGDGSANSGGVLINNTGFFGCVANQTPDNANVRILNIGTAYFGNATNYLNWDGSYLRIKGNLELTSIFNNINYTVVDLPIPPATEGFKRPTALEY